MNAIDIPMHTASRLRGPVERRADDFGFGTLVLARMLDEIDYGLLLVGAAGELRYANRLALQELGNGGPLQSAGGFLRTQAGGELAALRAALADAVCGKRSLVTLGHNGQALLVAVIPIDGGAGAAAEGLALLVLNKRASCAALTIDFYARSSGLTGTESTVLLRLSQGLKPRDIARTQGVALSTVRSHISSIRGKTHTASIGELTTRVAALPPFTLALKSAPTQPAHREVRPPAAEATRWQTSGQPQPIACAAC